MRIENYGDYFSKNALLSENMVICLTDYWIPFETYCKILGVIKCVTTGNFPLVTQFWAVKNCVNKGNFLDFKFK